VLPTSVQEGAVEPVGGGDGGLGVLDDELEPPPHATCNRQTSTPKAKGNFFFMIYADYGSNPNTFCKLQLRFRQLAFRSGSLFSGGAQLCCASHEVFRRGAALAAPYQSFIVVLFRRL